MAKKKKNRVQKQVAQPSKKLTIEVHEQDGFTEEEKALYRRAVQKAEAALNSKKFYTEFMKSKFTSTKGLSNQEIFDMLMSGIDMFNKAEDHDIDVFITMYYANTRVVGYTNPSTCKTWVNRKFFSEYDEADISCNLIHEYLHKVGFDHKSAKELTSVPYAVGYLLERVIREGHDECPVVVEAQKPATSAPEQTQEPKLTWWARLLKSIF